MLSKHSADLTLASTRLPKALSVSKRSSNYGGIISTLMQGFDISYLWRVLSIFIEDQVFIENREENKANIYEFLRHSNNFTIFVHKSYEAKK